MFMFFKHKLRAEEKTMLQYAEGITADDKIDCPLWWHDKGLSQTASGYGRKLTTRYKIVYQGRPYRIYATCCSNVASHYIVVKGQKLFLH